jgi:Tfp pilus assembly protein PilO
MALRKREKLLAVTAGALLVVLVAGFLLGGSNQSTAALVAERNRLEGEVQKQQSLVRKAERLRVRLAEWQRRSLPTDRALAQSLYQNWLLGLMEGNKLHRLDVKPGDVRLHRDVYHLFPFSVRFQSNQEELVRFLHAFYSASNLDQIRHLSIKPADNSGQLDVMLSIEAVALTGADRRDKLTTEPGKRLSQADVMEYVKTIGQRMLFTPYSAPVAERPPESKPEPPKFDVAKFVYLTAVTEADGQPQAWFRTRTSDQTFLVREGETFKVGEFDATVTRIGRREAELEIGGARHKVSLGANLRQSPGVAVEPKPDSPSSEKPDATPPKSPETK